MSFTMNDDKLCLCQEKRYKIIYHQMNGHDTKTDYRLSDFMANSVIITAFHKYNAKYITIYMKKSKVHISF